MVDTKQLATKQDVLAVKHDLEVVKHDLEIELVKTKHDILRWMMTAMITQTALLVGIIAFLR